MVKPKKLPSGRYRVQTLINGKRVGKTFDSSTEAKAWVTRQKVVADQERATGTKNITFYALAQKWLDEIGQNRLQFKKEKLRVEALLNGTEFGKTKLPLLDKVVVNTWKRKRLGEVSPATVRREWSLLSSICSDAINEFGYLAKNPFKEATRPDKPDARTRIPTDEELEKLLYCMGESRIKWATIFACETGMSAGEICQLQWSQVVEGVVHLPKFKTRPARQVPLTRKARDLLESLQLDDTFVFDLTSANLDALFRKYRNMAGIKDLHFHDLRAYAATRMSRQLTPFQLAKVLGHKNLKMITEVYYRESISDFAHKLDDL